MSFGGNQGTIRYALIVDDQQATTKLNTFKTSLTQVGQSSLAAGKNVATMGTQFNAGLNQIKSASAPLANLQKQTTGLGTSLKNTASKFSGVAVGLSATASSALQLAAGFRDYNDAQIAVERVTRKNSLAQEALGKAQTKLNDLQKSGKASSADLAAAQLDVTQAQQMASIQTQLLGEAQERLFDSQTQFVVSVVPTILGAFGTMGMAIKDLGLNFKSITGLGPKLSGAFLSLAGSADVASLSIKGVGLAAASVLAPIAALLTVIDIAPKMQKSIERQARANDMSRTIRQILEDEKAGLEELFQTFNVLSPSSYSAALARLGFSEKDLSDKREHLAEITAILNDKTKDLDVTLTSPIKKTENLALATDALNRALDYQLGRLPNVTSQAAEYAVGISETGEAAILAADAIQNYNSRALDYQLGRLPNVTSAAEEYAMGIDETGESSVLAAEALEKYNRAADYQNGTFRNITSQADEVAAGINEIVPPVKELTLSLEDLQKNATAFNKLGGLKEALGIKPADIKEVKDLFKDIFPQSFEKKMKLQLKFDQNAEDLKNQIHSIVESALIANEKTGDFTLRVPISDKEATSAAKELKKKIDDALKKEYKATGKKDPALAQLSANLGKALEDGVTASEWLTVLTSQVENAPPIKVVIVGDMTKVTSPWGDFKGSAAGEGVKFGNDMMAIGPGYRGGNKKTAAFVPVTGVITNIATTYGEKLGGTGTEVGTPFIESRADEDKTVPTMDFSAPLADVQTLQKAFDSLAKYGIKNLQALAKVAKIDFNSVANYAKGATTFIQTLQTATDSLTKYGVKNMQTLGKNAKTNFNSVANYANGATTNIQTLQKALDSLQKYGVKNMSALGKSAKTNFNSVANYANGATKAVKSLTSALNNIPTNINVHVGVSGPGLKYAQKGMHETLGQDTLIMAHKGERVDIGHESGGRSAGAGGGGGNGSLVINLTNVLADREITRTFRRELGKDIYRFGPT